MPTYATNKRVRFDYDILETVEAGLVLSGPEVKSVRGKQINLKGSYVAFTDRAAWLKLAHISPYRYAGTLTDYDPIRPRKLLLSKKEIAYLKGKTTEAGLTIVPLSVYTKGRHIKVELALVRGKKKYDKRASIKRREVEREIQRKIKEN